ncbi:MAG: ABC transporter ATP-binding protein [Longimicrobiales bacterium]
MNFAVHRGETVGLAGPSGAGKTVTALAILGLLPTGAAASGAVLWRGLNLLSSSESLLRTLRGREIALIPQDPMSALHPFYQVHRQVAEAVRAHQRDITRSDALDMARLLLDRVGIPRFHGHDGGYPFQWSGGMLQRALIAMAIAHGPALIIADEPTTALDATTRIEILRLLRSVQESTGSSILLITHDRDVMTAMADRVVSIGRVPPPASAHYAATAGSEQSAGEVLRVVDLAVHYSGAGGSGAGGHVRAVDGVSLHINGGETFAIVGESGCGKSTLARTLVGLERPIRGTISIEGQNLVGATRTALRDRRRRIQIVFQDSASALNPRRKVGPCIAEPLHIHGCYRGKGGPAQVAALLELVGLAPYHADRYPHQLSGGERQRVAIARAIALQPAIVVLDEPFTALDWGARDDLLVVLRRLQTEFHTALLLIAHDLQLVRQIAARTAVMRDGKFVEQGETAALFAKPSHDYTRALVAGSLADQTVRQPLHLDHRR